MDEQKFQKAQELSLRIKKMQNLRSHIMSGFAKSKIKKFLVKKYKERGYPINLVDELNIHKNDIEIDYEDFRIVLRAIDKRIEELNKQFQEL